MDTVDIITLVISGLALLGTLVGWTVEHHLSRKRDFANKKREMKTAYLIEAFRCVEKARSQAGPGPLHGHPAEGRAWNRD